MHEQGDGDNWAHWWGNHELFAYIEHRDDLNGDDGAPGFGTSWTMDVVREVDMKPFLAAGFPRERRSPLFPTAQIVLSIPGKVPEELDDFTEASWQRVVVNRDQPYSGTLYRDLDAAETQPIQFGVLAAPSKQVRTALEDLLSFDDAPEAADSDLAVLDKSGEYFAVYRVGQGNLNAICGDTGVPLVYYDFGGGCLANAPTYPTGLQYCQASNQPVLLSHWDFDHWFSATKFTFPAGTTWIAPAQTMGPRTKQFVHTLRMSGVNLLRWPQLRKDYVGNHFAITKCNGTSKNDSGLAIWVSLPGGSVLSPGDAEFNYVPIPTGFGKPLSGLVATHHGSSHYGNPVPKPGPNARIAFSFGSGNTFNHPIGSRAGYQQELWVTQYDTPNGHVALGGSGPQGPGCNPQCMAVMPQP